MIHLAFLCIISLMGQQYVAGVLDPGYEYVPEAETWLRWHIVPTTWQNARKQCNLEGGILASPSTDNLTKAMLFSMMTKEQYHKAFIGIHALVTESDFMSLDGVPLSEIDLQWAQGEPNMRDNGKCSVLTANGDISVESCTNAHPYFCRKYNATMIVNQECGTTAVGYEYFKKTGSCYKFHRHAKTWHQAARACHAEGAYLAIINSETEALHIKYIFQNNPVDAVIGAKHNDVAHVGFWKWENVRDREWTTIDGRTLTEAGFDQWGEGQPNDYDDVQYFGAIQRSGLFDDLAREDQEPFICEITPYI